MNFRIFEADKPYLLPQFGGHALGHAYAVTNRYLTRDGRPYLYRMGEMHFSRVPVDDWETELIKMREGGIEIVSSYLFWIHHEETEGRFDFSGNRNLRFFCETCRKVGMPFFLRLGPWAHGEARNGGFPDWLLQKCGGKEHTRTNEEPYLSCVRRYFERVYEEIKDCLDVIVGIQVENELQRNAEHMETLRQMIAEIGFRAPIWTATGWGPGGSGANLPKGTLLPVYGCYPEAPWAAHTEPFLGNDTFHFSNDWNSANIGTDIFGADDSSMCETASNPQQKTPYLTCEVGGGNQVTYHRRPIISSADITSGVICRLGSGCNGIGYYMYHGGKNPIGKTTMQESRATGYKNDYPIVSYDFQSPIGECGQLRDSYFELGSIHDFLKSCGEMLAPMPSYLPDRRPVDLHDKSTLRCAVRSDGKSGFFFFNNHAHAEKMQDLKENIYIELAGKNQSVNFPLVIPAGAHGIIPFRFPIGNSCAEWVTAMPVSVSESEVIFEKIQGIQPQICLSNGKILPLEHDFELGGVKVHLRQKRIGETKKLQSLEVRQIAKKLSDTVFSHIQNRDGSMLETVEAVDYEVIIPKGTQFIFIDAVGNAAAIYHGDLLIGDFYLYGDKWVVDTRALPCPTTLTLKILPLTEKNKKNIYFETDMPIGVSTPKVYS